MEGEPHEPALKRDWNFIWENAWGGKTYSTVPPMIHAAKIELRRHIGGLVGKKKEKVPFPVRSAKDLMIKLRKALDALSMDAYVVKSDVVQIPTTWEEPGEAPASACHIVSTVRLVCPDGSFCDMVGSGHGFSDDDKGGGKGSTYAWKDAVCKGCDVPDEEMVDTDDTHRERRPAKKGGTEAVVKDSTFLITFHRNELTKAKEAKNAEAWKAAITKAKAELSPEAVADLVLEFRQPSREG